MFLAFQHPRPEIISGTLPEHAMHLGSKPAKVKLLETPRQHQDLILTWVLSSVSSIDCSYSQSGFVAGFLYHRSDKMTEIQLIDGFQEYIVVDCGEDNKANFDSGPFLILRYLRAEKNLYCPVLDIKPVVLIFRAIPSSNV